jgi:PAS domain S-box-containing protein
MTQFPDVKHRLSPGFLKLPPARPQACLHVVEQKMNRALCLQQIFKAPGAACAQRDVFRLIFDAVQDGVFILDPQTGRFTEANRSGCEMFGYDRADLLEGGLAMLLSGVAPHTEQTARQQVAAGEPQLLEWQCRTADGRLFWAEVSVSSVKIGTVTALVAILRDISERKRAAAELALAHQSMSAASDAKSAFLATMSHELRTPLNAIIGFTDLMLSHTLGPISPPRYSEYLSDIHKSGEHLLKLINDVLDLTRLDAGKAMLQEEVVDLVTMIEASCRMVAPVADRAGVTLVVDLPATLPRLRGDARRIQQVVLNLLSNAV